MSLIKRKLQSNHRWQALRWCFSIILCFPTQVLSNPFFLTDLGENQIPIALSDNGTILIEDRSDSDNFTRYILANGVKIRAPEGATIDGLNEVGDNSPILTLVGRAPGLFDKFQANQWQLIGAGLNPIETAVWTNILLSTPENTSPSKMTGINGQGTVLGQMQSTAGNSELFYIDIDPEGRRNFNPPVHRDFPLDDYPQSEARAINASGDIVGVLTDTDGTKHSYIYRAQGIGAGNIMTNTLSTGDFIASEALDLSDRNANGTLLVVGKVQVGADRWQAYVATTDDNMQAIDTETLNGGNSVAKSVNNAGDVVGQAQNSEGQDRAFLYNIHLKTFVDLNDQQSYRLNFSSSPFASQNQIGIATDAIAINHRGSIVGTFVLGDKPHGYLLTSTKQDPLFHLIEKSISCLTTTCPIDFSARAIAIDNGWMALSQSGVNKVTLLQQGLDGTWFYHSTLTPTDTETYNQFGFSIALQDKRLVVGANLDDSAGTSETLNVGAIYIYEYNSATATWDLDQKILPNPSEVVADLNFGHTVSVYDNRILVTTLIRGKPGFFYVKSATAWQEFMISEAGYWGRMGESFVVFGYRNPIPIYPVTDNGLGITPTLISQYPFDSAIELHENTVAGTSGSHRPISIYHNKNNQWHHQALINEPRPDNFSGLFNLHADTLAVSGNRGNTLYFYNRLHENWRFQARHTLKFPPKIITLNRDILAVSSGDNISSIKIFSLTPPDRSGVDLKLVVDNPIGNIASNAGDLITFDATVTNRNLEREAWNVHLQIDIDNDQFMTNASDPRCAWLVQISKVNCVLGYLPAQASIPLAITLQHQSPQIDFAVVQQGTDPQPSDNTVSIDTQYSDANIVLTVTPSRSETTPDGTIGLTIAVQNHETKPIAALLTVSTDISVAYAGDSCDAIESPCEQIGELPHLRYIVKVPPEQSSTFTINLRFPSAGSYGIAVNVPLFQNIPTITTPIQVGPNVADIRILNRRKIYILPDNESMKPLSLLVRNWSLEDANTGKHIDWLLSYPSGLGAEDHTTTKSVSLGPLEPGNYTLEIRLIDTNHGSTDFKDTLSFTVQRPAPTVEILQPADNSTLRLSPGIGFDLQLDVENWFMRTGGKHYRWIWDGEETGNATALSLTISPKNLAEGSHQLMVELVDEDSTVPASNTITVIIEHPNDVTIHWRDIPNTMLIEQTIPVALTIINNNQETSATGVELSLTTTLIELTETTSLPSDCVLTTSTAITCQFPSLAASEQRDLSFTFISQQGTAELSATINQNNSTDPVSPPLSKTIQIIDPIDLSINSTWPVTDVRVNQTLQPTFTVTNQHAKRTATVLSISGPYPARLRLLNSIPSGCVIEDNTWQCSIDTLAPGDSRTINWQFIAMASGTMDYSVTVFNAQNDTDSDNNTHTTPIILTQPTPKITIYQPVSEQPFYRHPSPTDPNNYLSSIQLDYHINDWDQSERGIPHQVTINGGTPIERNNLSPLDITHNVIDGSNTIVIQLLDRDDSALVDPEVQITLTVAEGSIFNLPTPLPPVNSGALGGWLLLCLSGLLWYWRRRQN